MKTTSQYKVYSYITSFRIGAEEKDYLFIRKSQIPNSGNGLFTLIPIYKDEIISVFKGEILSEKEAKLRIINGKSSYFINMPDGKILDCMRVKCYAKYANDAFGTLKFKFRNNSEIRFDETGRVCLIANRDISANEEIFCSYGKEYWKNYIKIIKRIPSISSHNNIKKSN